MLSKLVFDNGTIDPNSCITNGASLLKKKTSKNYFMKAAFILDQHNQISNIVVSNIEEDDIRQQVIKSIQRCGKFYKNYTGKDLLVTLPFNFFKMYEFLIPKPKEFIGPINREKNGSEIRNLKKQSLNTKRVLIQKLI